MTPEPSAPETIDTATAQVRKFQRELSAGLTSLVLLSVLEGATVDLYGYEIARRLAGETEVRGGDRDRVKRQLGI